MGFRGSRVQIPASRPTLSPLVSRAYTQPKGSWQTPKNRGLYKTCTISVAHGWLVGRSWSDAPCAATPNTRIPGTGRSPRCGRVGPRRDPRRQRQTRLPGKRFSRRCAGRLLRREGSGGWRSSLNRNGVTRPQRSPLPSPASPACGLTLVTPEGEGYGLPSGFVEAVRWLYTRSRIWTARPSSCTT